jgi:hypothetical protein
MIGPPCCQQYKLGKLLAVEPLIWDEIIEVDYDDENCTDPVAPSSGRSHPGNDNDNDNGQGEEER